jgi:hypothetical protein
VTRSNHWRVVGAPRRAGSEPAHAGGHTQTPPTALVEQQVVASGQPGGGRGRSSRVWASGMLCQWQPVAGGSEPLGAGEARHGRLWSME